MTADELQAVFSAVDESVVRLEWAGRCSAFRRGNECDSDLARYLTWEQLKPVRDQLRQWYLDAIEREARASR